MREDIQIFIYLLRFISIWMIRLVILRKEDLIRITLFEKVIVGVFTKAKEGRVTESSVLMKTCLAIYDETAVKGQEWISQSNLAELIYGEDDEYTRDRIRKNINRIRKRLDSVQNQGTEEFGGLRIELIDNRKLLSVVRDAKGKLVTAYRFNFYSDDNSAETITTESGLENKSICHAGRYVGRKRKLILLKKSYRD